jgi:transglutaminase-like putative cysteine protease
MAPASRRTYAGGKTRLSLLAGLELSLLLVCMWGFIAVLITGQFSTVVIVACMIALIIGYRVRRSGWRPNTLIANIAAILVFLLSGAIYLGTFNLLIATVYLFLFLQVTKYVTRQKLVEARWCYLISLFNVIGASVITTAVTFGLMLMVYVFLALISLRLYVMAREWEASLPPGIGGLETADAARAKDPAIAAASTTPTPGRLPRKMLLTSALLTVIIMVIASGIFSAIPRLATQNLFQTYGPPQEEPAVSAFSENVEFGAFTEIQLDDAVALFVQPKSKTRPSEVRMRGVALDTFDGKAWSRTGPSVRRESNFEFRPIFTTHRYPTQFPHRVIQPPGITNFLFGDSFPSLMEVPRAFPFFVDRMAQTVFLQEMPPKEFQYDVVSMHEELSQRRDPSTMEEFYRPASHLTVTRDSYSIRGFDPGFFPDEEETDNPETSGPVPDMETTDAAVWPLYVETGGGESAVITDGTTQTVATWAGEDSNPPEAEGRHRWYRSDWRQVADEPTSPEAVEQWRQSQQAREERPTDEATSGIPWVPFDLEAARNYLADQPWRYGRRRYYRRSPQEVLQAYLLKCLALPETLNSGKIADLAQNWTQDAETTFSRAREIERRLRTEYGYSLTPKARGNFIESFLFDVQEGHCEYFATSMAVLLRNVGIPARVVNGYYSTEWNGLSGMFTVRQRDAHSWVEAWMGDNYGWMTFDPTPSAGVARRGDRSAIAQTMSRLSDAIRMRWYRYVVDYSFTDQVGAVREILQWRQNLMDALRQMDILGISSDDERQVELGDYTREIDWRPIGIAGVIVFSILIWQGSRWFARRRSQRYSSVMFYDRLLRLLANKGFTIQQGQTPREFAYQLASEWEALNDLPTITEEYYAAKFHERPPSPEIMHMIARLRSDLRKKHKG